MTDNYNQLMIAAEDIRQKAMKWAIYNQEREYYDAAVYHGQSVEQYFRNVPDLVRPYSTMPDPARYDPLIGALDAARKKLCYVGQAGSTGGTVTNRPDPVSGKLCEADIALYQMNEVERNLAGWQGTAAKAFMTNFVDPFPGYVGDQFLLLSVLYNAMVADQEMWAKARGDALSIVNTISSALDDYDSSGDTTWTMTWTIISSVAGVAGAAMEKGAAIALEAVAGGSQIAGAAPPGHEDLSGNTAHDIINTMKRQFADLKKYTDGIQGDGIDADGRHVPGIAKTLNSANAYVNGKMASFMAPRPALADEHGGVLTGDGGMGGYHA